MSAWTWVLKEVLSNLEREGGVLNWSIIGNNMNKETIVLDCAILVESDQCTNDTK